MLKLILILLFLVGSVWIGVFIMHHPGYLLLALPPWTIQMPLWFTVLASVLFLTLFYLFISGLDRCQFLGYRIKNWFRFRHEQKFYSKTQQGFAALIEGRYKQAEQLLLSGITQKVEPLMNYLGSAKAAHEQGAFERRDLYIQQAYRVAPKAEMAIGLTQSELELKQNQVEQAQATVLHLREKEPNHPRILKLLEKIYIRTQNWPQLLELMPVMRRAKILTDAQYDVMGQTTYCELFQASSTSTLENLRRVWQEVPRAMKKNPQIVLAYIKQLSRFQETSKEREEIIQKILKNQWQPELVNIYSELAFSNLNRPLVIVDAWIKRYGQQSELLLALGRLCIQAKLWGKAKEYFEQCLSLGPNSEASLEQGRLLEHLNEPDLALIFYRQGLEQANRAHASNMLTFESSPKIIRE